MMSLFSPFDLFFFYFSNMILLFLIMFFLNLVYVKSSVTMVFTNVYVSLELFFYSLKLKSYNKFSVLVALSVISNLFILNFFSVFSFTFPLTSQFGPVLSFSLSLWLSFIIFSLFNNFKGLVSHMIPEGTPIYLTMFLFLIEMISNLIRPLTLTVRLVANILAGHLLMILLSKLALFNPIWFFSYLILNTIEIFVSMIQSYIFTTMIILYFSEIH